MIAIAVACGGNDSNKGGGGDPNQASAATKAQAAEAFPLLAGAVQTAFVEGQNHQTPGSSGFTFAALDTSCSQQGTYAIDGSGVLADSGNPGAGGTYQFTTTFTQCASDTFAVDGAETEAATIGQTTAGVTTTTDEVIHITSDQLGFTITQGTQVTDAFTCGATDLNLHVRVTQITGQAPNQVVSGTGTWCTFTWENSFVGDYAFVPQQN